jgi:hypothetical protein
MLLMDSVLDAGVVDKLRAIRVREVADLMRYIRNPLGKKSLARELGMSVDEVEKMGRQIQAIYPEARTSPQGSPRPLGL